MFMKIEKKSDETGLIWEKILMPKKRNSFYIAVNCCNKEIVATLSEYLDFFLFVSYNIRFDIFGSYVTCILKNVYIYTYILPHFNSTDVPTD